MFQKRKLWGEMPQKRYIEPENIDISDVIRQAQEPDCLSNYDIASQLNDTKEITLPTMESKMLYAAELHKYKNAVKSIIDDAELAVEFNLVLQKPFPEVFKPEKSENDKVEKVVKPLHYVEKNITDFTKGKKVDPPYISEYTRKHIERQCIATMLAHIGFTVSSDAVLDTLTDVLEEFYGNIGQQLRAANDALLCGRTNHFPDIIEQVLTQSGLGGLQGIHDYYENRVIKYQTILEKRCKDLSKKYDELVTPDNISQDIKVENLENGFMDEEDIPEVHFTAIDGEGDYLQPFLESGFQMLNSLEEGQFTTS